MNNDGFGQVGAGQSDMRVAGRDLQHNRQTRTADELTGPNRIVRQEAEGGGPVKENLAHNLQKEAERHAESKKIRLQHLAEAYKR
jgi:hypothetical protein